jgi:hypothetical protein
MLRKAIIMAMLALSFLAAPQRVQADDPIPQLPQIPYSAQY